MDIICTNWFIYNITEHIDTTDLCRLKFINKYYYKQITKQYILDAIGKNISKSTDVNYKESIYILKKNFVDPENHMCPPHLTIPYNTLYKLDIKATPVNAGPKIFISSKIRNVFGKLDICELNYKEHSPKVLEYRIINNSIRMAISPTIPDEKWFINIKIKSTTF